MVLWVIMISLGLLKNGSDLAFTLQGGNSLMKTIAFIVVLMGSFMWMRSIPVEDTIYKHTVMILWLSIFSIIVSNIFRLMKMLDVSNIKKLLVEFIAVITVASGFTVYFPHLIKEWWSFAIMVGLVALIVVNVLFSFMKINLKQMYYVTVFAIAFFSIIIAYDTKKALDASETCVEGKADYIKFSSSLFIDFANLLSNLVRRRRLYKIMKK
jgi:hypothetical protein